MKLNKLTPEEERGIVQKGTEAPYSGEYEKFNQEAFIPAEDVGLLCTAQKTSLTLIADGRALIRK